MPKSATHRPTRRKARTVRLDGETLSLEQLEQVADGAPCALAPAARARVGASRQVVDRAVAAGEQVYGVNTGFGHLAQVRIDDARLAELQQNLVRSHAAGVGDPLPERVVRAILTLRANCLARGHSGIRLETLERLIEMLELRLCPIVPEHGSVGASGDLAPLAHIALAVIGEGEVLLRGRRVPAARAWKSVRRAPVELAAKEGLALINGTQVMTGLGALALLAAERLTTAADITGAMSLEALMGSHRAFDPRVHRARPHPGQLRSAANVRKIIAGSEIERAHRECGRVQDCYSLRCMAQVHGAVRDALAHVRQVLEIEANASTDNPMVFVERGQLVSGGNFHGQPVSIALDQLTTAIASLANISERRLERLVNPDHSELPAFLAGEPGLDSGFMLAQVTAAALCSECKLLAHPASVDSIPTSANKEDHVSMGVHAARKAAAAVEHVTTVLGIELLVAAQALDMRRPLVAGRGVEAARAAFRRRVRRMRRDRVMAPDIERARSWVADGKLRQSVEDAGIRLDR